MKRHIVKQALYLIAGVFILSACNDDSTDYKPEKPIGGYNSVREIAPESLVGYWAFENSLTDSAGSLQAAPTNVTYTSGKKGQGFQGAANGYAVINNAGSVLPALTSYTISFWAYTAQASKATGIFTLNNSKDFWGNLDIYLEPYAPKGVPNVDSLFFKIHMNNDNVVWKGQFTDTKFGAAVNKWVHIAATYDGDKSIYNVYINGKQIGVNTAGNPQGTKGPKLHGDDPATHDIPYGLLKFVNASKIAFGAFQFQTSPSLNEGGSPQDWATNYSGALDEFRIYNKALAESDINSIYKLESLGR
ncbi:LamG domain-containing protein [Solitalea sp. MAHUQ-68]|uniref:LamG domain-containing protein n=1 Tax=Solitalea agri TaxID=2953739 RepID=A0A9X2F4W6_9SPHI|nr:LamG domain-containing protein [Solitalea agri]MCO4294244.1 LamG domain-containing protein [Solitalea agri]